MTKSEVYSWRISRELKHRLSLAARERQVSFAELLEAITAEWLRHEQDPDDEAQQRALHAAAARSIGSIAGGDPKRAQRVRETVREKLRNRRKPRSP